TAPQRRVGTGGAALSVRRMLALAALLTGVAFSARMAVAQTRPPSRTLRPSGSPSGASPHPPTAGAANAESAPAAPRPDAAPAAAGPDAAPSVDPGPRAHQKPSGRRAAPPIGTSGAVALEKASGDEDREEVPAHKGYAGVAPGHNLLPPRAPRSRTPTRLTWT